MMMIMMMMMMLQQTLVHDAKIMKKNGNDAYLKGISSKKSKDYQVSLLAWFIKSC